MRHLTSLLLLCALPISGCELLIGATDRAECADRDDCPLPETCNIERGRCEPELYEAFIEDAQPLDAQADLAGDAELDHATLDLAVDAGPVDAEITDGDTADADTADADLTGADLTDAAPRVMPYGPDAECFPQADGFFAPAAHAGTYVPWMWCTPYALAWTAQTEAGPQLWIQRGPDTEPEALLTLDPEPELVVHQHQIAFVGQREGHRNVGLVDLTDGTWRWLAPLPAAQRQPAISDGLVGFVQSEGDREGVQLVPAHTPGTVPCGRRGIEQWGLTLRPDGAAWFERDDRGRTTIQLSPDPHCRDRIAIGLLGPILPSHRLHATADALFWLQAAPDGHHGIWRLDLLDLARGPHPVGDPDAHHLELSAGGGRIAATRYRPGGYRIDTFPARQPDQRSSAPGRANMRHPTLSASHLLWMQQEGTHTWFARYLTVEAL